jgi:2-polyprenyl-3-methyl-5-hydroxy-6-metoxy-1,4-benzoquinol methylase
MVACDPFEGGHVYCNKIQQCFTGAFKGYERVILTDADMFFLAPPQIPMTHPFAGKIVDMPLPPLEIQRSLYQEAGIQPSDTVPVDCALSEDERTFKSNLNGGFYCIDGALMDELGRQWKKHALWTLGRIERLGAYQAHVDQIAMALTLDELKIDVALLPAQVNFPIHLGKNRLGVLCADRIDVLHYHSNVLPNGLIKATGLPPVDGAIARANGDITAIIGDNFDNALFWNNRYANFPELGSGVGSRGEVLEYKKERLRHAVRFFEERSVLEIGCGDLETSKDLNLKYYLGRDLSAAALEIARAKRPDWRFIQGTLDHADGGLQADLVICLDVLIHQKRADDYRALISRLARTARRRLIVSGYESPPSFVSNIVAYHEPLSVTLRGIGVFNEIIEIGKYRDVSLFVADTRRTGPAFHPNDIPFDMLAPILPRVSRLDLLSAVMDSSREHFGFFTKTTSRAIEYPWLLDMLGDFKPGSRVLDIGAGVTPLPILLAERGLYVHTVDNHPLIRKLDTRSRWNEWGFIDYGDFSPHARSSHVDILKFQPEHHFDAVYSVSVIEHMPRKVWERAIALMASWIEPGGLLLLTLDLTPGTNALWNMSEGKVVDREEAHGVLGDIADTLRGFNLEVENLVVEQKIPGSRTDVAFLRSRKARS